MSKIIKNGFYNIIYSLKFLLINKAKKNILIETEYKLGFIFSIITLIVSLFVSYLSAIFASDFLNLDRKETLLILFFYYFFWDFGSIFMLRPLFQHYWKVSLFPLNENIALFNSYSIRKTVYFLVELFFILLLAIQIFHISFLFILKLLLFLILLSLIFSFLLNNLYLIGTILFKTDSYLFSDFVAELQWFFSIYNPSYIQEKWFKFILFVFMIPFCTYLIVEALKGNFLLYFTLYFSILILEIVIFVKLMNVFKKVYEAYGG